MPQVPSEEPGAEVYMTVRQMVAEIRVDVKDLKEEAARLALIPDTTIDHEDRIRGLERWKYTIPPTMLIAVASVVTAVLTNH